MVFVGHRGLGITHGRRRKYLQSYPDALTVRRNRRRTRHAACRPPIRVAARRQPVTYKMLIAKRATGKAFPAIAPEYPIWGSIPHPIEC
jgi:hypothetical protein